MRKRVGWARSGAQEHNTRHLPLELREAAFERRFKSSTSFKVIPLSVSY